MEASTNDPAKIRMLRKVITIMSREAEDVTIQASRDSMILKCVGDAESILFSIDFSSQFFDTYEFHLGEPISRSVSLKPLSTIFRIGKSVSVSLQIISNEKIIIKMEDAFGSIHTYTLFLSSSACPDNPADDIDFQASPCFSMIECSTDIFGNAGKCFDSSTDVSTFILSRSAFRVETGDETNKPAAILVVSGSDSCRIYSRFKAKLCVVFADILSSVSIANVLSKKMQILIKEDGPITITSMMGTAAKMTATIAASKKDKENDDVEDELYNEERTIFKGNSGREPILTAPTTESLNARSTIRAEAHPMNDLLDHPKRRSRTIIPIEY